MDSRRASRRMIYECHCRFIRKQLRAACDFTLETTGTVVISLDSAAPLYVRVPEHRSSAASQSQPAPRLQATRDTQSWDSTPPVQTQAELTMWQPNCFVRLQIAFWLLGLLICTLLSRLSWLKGRLALTAGFQRQSSVSCNPLPPPTGKLTPTLEFFMPTTIHTVLASVCLFITVQASLQPKSQDSRSGTSTTEPSRASLLQHKHQKKKSPMSSSVHPVPVANTNKKQCRDTVGAMFPHYLVWGTKFGEHDHPHPVETMEHTKVGLPAVSNH